MIRSNRYTAVALLIGSVVCAIDAASKVLVVADLTSRHQVVLLGGLRYRCRVSNPPSRTTWWRGVRSATATTLEAASMAHTTDPIKRAAAVYRLDLSTPASTTACYCRTGAQGHIARRRSAKRKCSTRNRISTP